MRTIAAAALATCLVTTAAFADNSVLPAGQAAGTHAAQIYADDNTVFYVIGIAAIAAGIAILASNSHHNGVGGGSSGGAGGGGGGSSSSSTTTTTT